MRLYTDQSKIDDQPPYLHDSQYWFSLSNFGQSIKRELLEDISDSEIHQVVDDNKIIEETTLHTLKSLKNLIKQVDALNETLDNVKERV